MERALTNAIEPEVRQAKQLDDGIDDTFVSGVDGKQLSWINFHESFEHGC